MFDAAASEFPAVDAPSWDGYLHVNETKFANPRPHEWGPTLQAIARTLNGEEFVGFLRQLTGFARTRSQIRRWTAADSTRHSQVDSSTSIPTSPRTIGSTVGGGG